MIAWLRDLIFHDFWLKLFSLALAVLIWLTVYFTQSGGGPSFLANRGAIEQTYHSIPVQALVSSSASEVRTFTINPDVVAVTVRGDRKTLQKLQPKDIKALVDLTDIPSARGMHKRIEVTTPPGVTFVLVEPNEVEVILPPSR